MPLKFNLADVSRDLGIALRRFPLPALAGLAAYGCLLALISDLTYPVETQVARLLMTCVLALPLWFGLAIRRAHTGGMTRLLPELVGVGLIAVYGWFLQILPLEFPFRWGVQFAILLVAVHCFVACAPFLRNGNSPAFWNYNKTLFLRWLLGTLYAAVLFGGLALALFSVDRLLSLHIDGKNYPRLFFGIVTVFHPLFFLAGAPHKFSADDGYPAGLRRFVQFCLMPLVGLYVVILYLYTAKILITWELPNGWVALPVLILAVGGILSVLLLDPLREDQTYPWAGWFSRRFYRLLLPLTILLMISIGVRLTDYGVTENRYIVATLAGWLFLIAASYGWLGLRATRWIPLSLGVLCLFAAFGPGSASAVSERSQHTRVMAKLTELGLVQGDKFVAKPQTLAKEDFDDLQSRLDYLFKMHGTGYFDAPMADVPAWKPSTEDRSAARYGRNYELLQRLGVSTTQETVTASRFYKTVMPIAVIADAQLSVLELWNHQRTRLVISKDPTLTLTWEASDTMLLRRGNATTTIDWKPQLQAVLEHQSDDEVPAAQLTQQADIDGYRVTLTFLTVNIARSARGNYIVNNGRLLVLVQPLAP